MIKRQVASNKCIRNSRQECKNHTLVETKMVKIVTLFMSKTAKTPYSLGRTCPSCLAHVRDPSDRSRSLIISPVPQQTSINVISCLTCTLCKKLYIGETGRRLDDLEKDDQNASKPVARYFNLPNHSKQHMAVCGLSPHQVSTEAAKFIFQIGTPNGINERFSFN